MLDADQEKVIFILNSAVWEGCGYMFGNRREGATLSLPECAASKRGM